MSAKPWFAWYSTDYRAKTAHLTYIESEAYRRLLEAYYERRRPLPDDQAALCRLASAQDAAEREAIHKVASEFFTAVDGELHHQRCDEEIAKAQARHEAWVKAGSKGGLNSAQGRLEAGFKGGSSNPQPQSHITVTTTPKESKPLAPSDKPLDATDPVNGVCYIPLADKTEFAVPQTLLSELETAYPAVDGPATLKEIRAWCVTNPSRCKTRRGVARFINRWFQKVQDHG